MAQYEVNWHIEGRVILARPWGHHTVESANAFGTAIASLMDAGQPPVHLIVDDSGVQSAPRRLDQLLRAMSFVQHPAFGWGIMIGNAPLSHRFLIDLIGRLSPVSYHRLDTLSEAMAFLHAQDPSLEVDDVV